MSREGPFTGNFDRYGGLHGISIPEKRLELREILDILRGQSKEGGLMATVERTLRPIVILLYVNVGISILLTVLTFVFKSSVLDYQVQHMVDAGKVAPGREGAVRSMLEGTLWIRPLSILVVSVVYVRFVARLKHGMRRTYYRLLAVAIIGAGAIAYLIIISQFPVWYRVIQGVQGLVLLSLLPLLATKDVREHFAPKPEAMKIWQD